MLVLILYTKLQLLVKSFTICQAWSFQLLKFNSHHFILMLKLLYFSSFASNLLKLRVFFFKMKQLLMYITSATTPFQIENLLQVLNFFLQLLNVNIILCTHLICLNLNKYLLGSVSKLQGWDSFINVINHRWNGCNQCCLSITTKWILK